MPTTTDILGRVWDATATAKRSAVCDALHYSSATRLLTDAEWLGVRLLADGFGRVTAETAEGRACLADWSHVRDSSPDAFAAMHTYLAERGYVA